ncbi:hypothetical protein QTP88_008910 [Uroleucon formosanum]
MIQDDTVVTPTAQVALEASSDEAQFVTPARGATFKNSFGDSIGWLDPGTKPIALLKTTGKCLLLTPQVMTDTNDKFSDKFRSHPSSHQKRLKRAKVKAFMQKQLGCFEKFVSKKNEDLLDGVNLVSKNDGIENTDMDCEVREESNVNENITGSTHLCCAGGRPQFSSRRFIFIVTAQTFYDTDMVFNGL